MDQALVVDFARWLNSVPGQYVRAWEQRQLDDELANIFGYHAIQIGLPHWPLLQASRISRQWCVVDPAELPSDRKGLVLAEPACLPFETHSIDLLVLPHVLEWARDPHQVLREADRVLVPEGRIVICGFNPWSLWGLRERVPGLEPRLPVSSFDLLASQRLRDWLELLSFDVQNTRYGCYLPLCLDSVWMQRWQKFDVWGPRWWSLAGAVYMMSAVKRVQAIRMVGPSWKNKQPVLRPSVVVTGKMQVKE